MTAHRFYFADRQKLEPVYGEHVNFTGALETDDLFYAVPRCADFFYGTITGLPVRATTHGLIGSRP